MAQKNQYGNTYKTGHFKYKTSEERKIVFKKLYDHLAAGLPISCFPPLSTAAIKDYCKKFPLEFLSDQINEAKRVGECMWRTIGKESLFEKDFKDKTYQFMMMNSYGMSLNQNSNVKITDDRDVKKMSDDELNGVVDE